MTLPAAQDPAPYIAATQQWLEKAVIGLNLCPFAKAVHVKNKVRYAVSVASDEEGLREDLCRELDALQAADPEVCETSLLIAPWVLGDFLDFSMFLRQADACVKSCGLRGVMQIASFHPDYQFAESEADDVANYSNRSPYPTLHLLRESSIERAVAAFPDAADIYDNNIATLERLGHAGWRALWRVD